MDIENISGTRFFKSNIWIWIALLVFYFLHSEARGQSRKFISTDDSINYVLEHADSATLQRFQNSFPCDSNIIEVQGNLYNDTIPYVKIIYNKFDNQIRYKRDTIYRATDTIHLDVLEYDTILKIKFSTYYYNWAEEVPEDEISVLGKTLPVESSLIVTNIYHFYYNQREYVSIFMLPQQYANMVDPQRVFLFDITDHKHPLAMQLDMTNHTQEECFHDVERDGILDYISQFPYNDKEINVFSIENGKAVEKKDFHLEIVHLPMANIAPIYVNIRKSKWYFPLKDKTLNNTQYPICYDTLHSKNGYSFVLDRKADCFPCDTNLIELSGTLYKDTIPYQNLSPERFYRLSENLSHKFKKGRDSFYLVASVFDSSLNVSEIRSYHWDNLIEVLENEITVLGKRLKVDNYLVVSEANYFKFGNREYVSIIMLPQNLNGMRISCQIYLFDISNRKRPKCLVLPDVFSTLGSDQAEYFHDLDGDGKLDFIYVSPFEDNVVPYSVVKSKLKEKKGYYIDLLDFGTPGPVYIVKSKSKWFFPLKSKPEK